MISVDEYLSTSYPDGDLEYLNGRLVERNIGDFRHGRVQGVISALLFTHHREFWCAISVRVRVSSSRYRIPDVCLGTTETPPNGPLLEPPFLAVEILSPDDRAVDMQEKIDDYLGAGVSYVWVVNPITRSAYVHTSEGSREAKDAVLRTDNPRIDVPLAALFD